MDKQEIINKVNDVIKNEPIADLKQNLYKNSDGDKFRDLMQYNSILDHIATGPHTTKVIESFGVEWKFRILGAEEFINICHDVVKIAREKEWFDDIHINYQTMLKVLAKALSPSPFKQEGKGIFSEDDLKLVNYDVLENIYRQYVHFNDTATRKPTEMSEEEIESLLDIVKKKHVPLRDLDRKQLLTVANYYMNLSQTQAKMLNEDSTS